jgi:hypothetical protein
VAQVKLERLSHWTDEAADALRAVTAEDERSIERDVNAGTCELWCVDGHSYMVTNVDADSRELIVCCYAGRDVLAIADVLYRIARRQGLVAVRFFTKRPALARKLSKFPLQIFGYVYRCEVPPNVSF